MKIVKLGLLFIFLNISGLTKDQYAVLVEEYNDFTQEADCIEKYDDLLKSLENRLACINHIATHTIIDEIFTPIRDATNPLNRIRKDIRKALVAAKFSEKDIKNKQESIQNQIAKIKKYERFYKIYYEIGENIKEGRKVLTSVGNYASAGFILGTIYNLICYKKSCPKSYRLPKEVYLLLGSLAITGNFIGS